MQNKIGSRINEDALLTEKALESFLDVNDERIPYLFDAMRYSVLGAGKRVRPFLVLEFCRLAGGNIEDALPFACALEMIHSYSLVHDDLPCMDNDVLRRGKPTTHVEFGYANALLAGDALLTYAFEVALAAENVSDSAKCEAIKLLSSRAGAKGMIGGQQIDLDCENKNISIELLEYLHSLKTGALISCACELGCVAAGLDAEHPLRKAAVEYASHIGVTFQIIDDILDVVGDEAVFGKPIGSDAEQGKTTFLSFMSVPEAREYAAELTEKAKSVILNFGESDILCGFADYLLNRNK